MQDLLLILQTTAHTAPITHHDTSIIKHAAHTRPHNPSIIQQTPHPACSKHHTTCSTHHTTCIIYHIHHADTCNASLNSIRSCAFWSISSSICPCCSFICPCSSAICPCCSELDSCTSLCCCSLIITACKPSTISANKPSAIPANKPTSHQPLSQQAISHLSQRRTIAVSVSTVWQCCGSTMYLVQRNLHSS